jgi:hypothetical protein
MTNKVFPLDEFTNDVVDMLHDLNSVINKYRSNHEDVWNDPDRLTMLRSKVSGYLYSLSNPYAIAGANKIKAELEVDNLESKLYLGFREEGNSIKDSKHKTKLDEDYIKLEKEKVKARRRRDILANKLDACKEVLNAIAARLRVLSEERQESGRG